MGWTSAVSRPLQVDDTKDSTMLANQQNRTKHIEGPALRFQSEFDDE